MAFASGKYVAAMMSELCVKYAAAGIMGVHIDTKFAGF